MALILRLILVLLKGVVLGCKKSDQSAYEKQKAEELAGINNQAYQTLLDDDLRMTHLLDLEELLPEEGKAQLPQAFLMAMMDINEALMELEFESTPEKKSALHQELENLSAELKESVLQTMQQWDAGELVDLQPVVEYHMKKRYVRRLLANLEKLDS